MLMRGLKEVKKIIAGNKGISLVELLVVIAIMSIAVGITGISISLAYSRDAEKCAKTINAALENTRMLSLSEKGEFTMELDMVNNIVSIKNSLETQPVHEEELQKKVKLSLSGDTSLTLITIQFDKSTGKVIRMDGEDNGILRITAENNSGKRASVVLVKGTGKHYVDYK